MGKIEWTEDTWNPIAGCSIVSTECKNCYAMTMARRLELMGQKKYAGTTEVREHIEDGKVVSKHVVWTGKINADAYALGKPLKTRKPTTYFVNSMSDLFHEGVTGEQQRCIYEVMQQANQHTYQILTKRPQAMAEWTQFYFNALCNAPAHIWHGTSVGYKPAKSRIEQLREVKSAVRFLSCEPLLEDLGELDLTGIHWVIIGGESGHGARPMELEWARNIVRQCRAQGVKIFVKQLGAYPILDARYDKTISGATRKLQDRKGGDMDEWPEDLRIREFPSGGERL